MLKKEFRLDRKSIIEMIETKIKKEIPIKIAEEEVYRYLGYRIELNNDVRPDLKNIVREEIEQLYPLLESKGIYRFLTVKSLAVDGAITTEQNYQFSVNKKVINFLQNSQYLLFAVVTIGAKVEEYIKERFKQNQPLRAMVLDAAGTVAVKMAGQWLNHFLEEENKQYGFQFSRYFEPGSNDWDIKEQQKVFTILGPERIDVTLNSSYMMQPSKSLSWIRGMGYNLVHSFRDELTCRYCSLLDCPFRKKEEKRPNHIKLNYS